MKGVNVVMLTMVIAMLFMGAMSMNLRTAKDAQLDTVLQQTELLQLQVQKLQAESAIRHKLQTYMPVLAASDWDSYVNYFTRDGKIIMAEGTRQGRDDIRERMSSAAQRMAAAAAAAGAPVRKRADLLTNVEVEVTSATTANAQSRFVFLAENAQGGFEVTGSGRYVDEWALEEGEWRIAARTIDYDLLRAAAPAVSRDPQPEPITQQ